MENSNTNYVVGIDIGGSHITAAIVDLKTFSIIENSLFRKKVDSSGSSAAILETWVSTIKEAILITDQQPSRLGIAMPGPFDYENGISLIKDLHKYDALYGINIKEFLSKELNIKLSNICFRNDAEAFLAGEIAIKDTPFSSRIMGVTLGTGLGSAMSYEGNTWDTNLSVVPFLDGVSEEYISTRWFTRRFKEISGIQVTDVKEILLLDNQEKHINQLFQEFTTNLSQFLIPIIKEENIDELIIGGNIAKTADRFIEQLKTNLYQINPVLKVSMARLGEMSAITGASSLFKTEENITL